VVERVEVQVRQQRAAHAALGVPHSVGRQPLASSNTPARRKLSTNANTRPSATGLPLRFAIFNLRFQAASSALISENAGAAAALSNPAAAAQASSLQTMPSLSLRAGLKTRPVGAPGLQKTRFPPFPVGRVPSRGGSVEFSNRV